MVEDIRLVLNETITNYIEKISLTDILEGTTLKPLISYRLLEYDQLRKYKDLFNKTNTKNANMIKDEQQKAQPRND